jgi:HEAT repeat protein
MSSQHQKYVEKWVGYLNTSDREMSRIAAKKLGASKDPAVVPVLAKALNNRPDEVRLAAARALGEIGDPSAVPFLIQILHDSDPLVASAAADSLGEIGSEKAVPHLIEILKDYKSANSRHFQIHGFNRGLYMAAVHALERIGSADARRAIARYHR